MSERGPEIQFNPESISKAVNLSKVIEYNKILGDSSPESNEKVGRLLGSYFPGKYDSVQQMIDFTKDSGKSEIVQQNAKQSLALLGAAMCLTEKGRGVELAAVGKLSENLPSNLSGIEEYVDNNLFVSGDDDETGKFIVDGLINLEKINKKLTLAPTAFAGKKEAETQKIIEILLDKFDKIDDNSEGAIKIGAVVGYLDGELKKNIVDEKVFDEKHSRTKRDEYPDVFTDKKDGEDSDSRKESATRSWEIDPEHMADALKFMAGDLRWSDWTPPEWFKELETKNPEEAYRISVMTMINEVAGGVVYSGKDLDKIYKTIATAGFTHEHMSKLFNEDFKIVMSKMLNDLCELTSDQNGRQCLRYKEGLVKKNDGKEIWTIKPDVVNKIKHIKEYEEEMVLFLAKKNGREKANYMDKMNAYTAWNMFYGLGGSSMADRMRVLPTYGGVICDAMRTLNPEYKALGKWMIQKSGEYKSDENLFDAEYFSGPLADYVLKIMNVERDIRGPIDGSKTLRQKIVDGEMALLTNKTFYSFFDFVHGGRDLYKGDFVSAKDEFNGQGKPENFYSKTKGGEEVTLAELLMDYGEYKGNKFVKKESARKFNFGNDQVTFMNEFGDMLEGGVFVYNCTMGKTEVKDPAVWARNLKDKIGMIGGIEINGKKALSYMTSVELWRDAIIGSFGVDMDRLSSNHMRIKVELPKGNTSYPAYNLYLNKFITRTLGLSNNDVNVNEIMRLLGVSLKQGESAESIRASIRNKSEWVAEGVKTNSILNRQSKLQKLDSNKSEKELPNIVNGFNAIKESDLKSEDAKNIYRSLGRAIRSGNIPVIERLWKEFLKINK